MPIFAKGHRVVAIDGGAPIGNCDMIGRTTDRANFLVAKVSVEVVTVEAGIGIATINIATRD